MWSLQDVPITESISDSAKGLTRVALRLKSTRVHHGEQPDQLASGTLQSYLSGKSVHQGSETKWQWPLFELSAVRSIPGMVNQSSEHHAVTSCELAGL